MTVLKHELKQGRKSFLIWVCALCFLLGVCIFLFPEMKKEMDTINEMFSSMGAFTAAFGMDKLNFGTLIGYYAIECGNVMGLGGAFFAALCAVSILSKEEKEKTAEFLLTHPVGRIRIITEKLLAVLAQVVLMNVVVFLISVGSMAAVGEGIPWKEVVILHLAYLFMQLELAGICFGVSAYIMRSSVGIGLGIAIIMYFLNIMANITDKVSFLKYITPFGYCDGSAIVTDLSLDVPKLCIGAAFCLAGIAAAYVNYSRKDIH